MATYLDLDALNAAGVDTPLVSEGYSSESGDVAPVYALSKPADEGYDPADETSGSAGFYLYAQDTPEGATIGDDVLTRYASNEGEHV
jgi:hypothetical protein